VACGLNQTDILWRHTACFKIGKGQLITCSFDVSTNIVIHILVTGSFVYIILHHCQKEKINVRWKLILAEIILLTVAQNALQLASWSFVFIYSLIIAQIQPRDIVRIMRSRDGRVIITPFRFFVFFCLKAGWTTTLFPFMNVTMQLRSYWEYFNPHPSPEVSI
jgi:hypothetical protein